MTARASCALIAFAAFAAGSAAAAPAVRQVPGPFGLAAPVPTSAPSRSVVQMIDWVIRSRDNGSRPFVIIDKVGAELFAFDGYGRFLARTPVLIGVAKGDHTTPGVGDRKLSRIPVSQRTTPAGRFRANFGPAIGPIKEVLWVDHADALSLHPVVTTNRKERRWVRLNSPTPDDNRITFGCINVTRGFYQELIEPLFRPNGGLVYILPEQRPLHEVFAGLPLQPRRPARRATLR
jgi:hypothetical protein